MHTIASSVYFTSANVTNQVIGLIEYSSLRPNKTYTINLNGIDHIKATDGNVSSLSGSYLKFINGNTLPFTLLSTISTPGDNVESDIDLLRTSDTTIRVHVNSINSPNYPSTKYTGWLDRYNIFDLSGTNTVITNLPNLGAIGTFNIPDLLTAPYYFAARFDNGYEVVREEGSASVQKNQVFDIRGLAYFRDYSYTTPYILRDPPIVDANTNAYNFRVALSADGSILLKSQRVSSSILKFHLYKDRKLINSLSFEGVALNNEGVPLIWSRRYGGIDIGHPVAISGDATRCVVVCSFTNEPSIKVIDIDINTNLMTFGSPVDLTVPSVYKANYIHNVCMSMDGNTILISGSDITQTYGYAHVYNYDGSAWSSGINLSSSHIRDFSYGYSYGTDSCLSGDGKTIVIFGGPSIRGPSTTDTGYVWKYNEFSSAWEDIQKISTNSYLQRTAPCSLSHRGATLLVTTPFDNQWMVFEYDEGTKLFTGPVSNTHTPISTGYSMTEGSMSGDGNIIVFGESTPYNMTVYLYVYKKTLGTWSLYKTIPYSEYDFVYRLPHVYPMKVLVSFDGGLILLGANRDEMGINQLCLFKEKKSSSIISVFDYMNERSVYDFVDYDRMGDPIWGVTPQETHLSVGISTPHYGTVDALSMSMDGQKVIVGSPEVRSAYLYSGASLLKTFANATTGFGIRCSMDDTGNTIVIASNTKLYVYDGQTPYALKHEISHGFTASMDTPWNMKISKDGSTIIASDTVSVSSFKAWTRNDISWSSSTMSTYNSSAVDRRVSAIDLSANGSVMIAAGFQNTTMGYVHMFHKGTGTNTHQSYIEIPGNGTHYVGQSIALSGLGNKAIVGAVSGDFAFTGEHDDAKVFLIDIEADGNMIYTPVNNPNKADVRYGRNVSIDYHGNYAMVSGSKSEYVGDSSDGSALVINMADYSIASESFTKTGLTYNGSPTPTYRPQINGYGVNCKLSSRGDVAAVSGGGYAYSFKVGLTPRTIPTLAYFYSAYDIMIRLDAQNTQGYALNATTNDVDKVFDLTQNVKTPYEASVVGKGPRIGYTHNPMTLTTDINGHNTFHGFAQFGLVPTNTAYMHGDYNSGHVMKKNTNKSFTMVFVVQFDANLGADWAGILTYYLQNGIKGLCLTRRLDTNQITVGSGTKINILKTFITPTNTPLVIVSRFENVSNNSTLRFNQYLKVVNINTRTVLHDTHEYHQDNPNAKNYVFTANGGPLFIGCDEFMHSITGYPLPNLKWGEVLMYNEFLENPIVDVLINLLVDKWKA